MGSLCEMMVIGRADLQSLFEKSPKEMKLFEEEVFHEHARKQQVRSISLKLLVNHLKGDDKKSEDKKSAAALRVQMAWGKYCDVIVAKQAAKMLEHEEPTKKLADLIAD